MIMDSYDPLKLENQLCFPLYCAAKKVVQSYTPFLDRFDLTYTQYITMMALWEKQTLSIAELGSMLHLDSGTLTPLVKKLIQKGLVLKKEDKQDRRMVSLTLTRRGKLLKEKIKDVPAQVRGCFPLSLEESIQLHNLLEKVIAGYED